MTISNFFKLEGSVAVITGGGGVLGGTIAEALSEAGASVVLMGRSLEKLEKKASQIIARGGKALAIAADVLDREQLIQARDQIAASLGKIDILVNAAGGNLPGAIIQPQQSIFDLSVKDFEEVVALNLQGTLLPVMVFGEHMATSGKGCILNFSSVTAQRPLTRVTGYSAAKGAIDNLTKWLAVELAGKYGEGIRVNAIAPGFFIGDQNRKLLLNDDGSLSARGETIIAHTPMKRFGRPEDLCGAALWLCSDAAAFVTGTVVLVDGGFCAFSGV